MSDFARECTLDNLIALKSENVTKFLGVVSAYNGKDKLIFAINENYKTPELLANLVAMLGSPEKAVAYVEQLRKDGKRFIAFDKKSYISASGSTHNRYSEPMLFNDIDEVNKLVSIEQVVKNWQTAMVEFDELDLFVTETIIPEYEKRTGRKVN